jgi:protocadherin delta 1
VLLVFCCYLVATVTRISGEDMAAPLLAYTVREGRPAHTFVGNVRKDSKLSSRYPAAVFDTLHFSFYQPGPLNDLFTLDPNTGRLLTSVTIDREQLCATRALHCDVISLDVKVIPYQYFEILKVKVTIEDDNDNAPVFSMTPVEWVVSESASIGTEFPLPLAIDADNGTNGIQSYELVTANEAFALKQVNQSYGMLEASIVLIGRLDRETGAAYRLQVDAIDGGTPALRGTLWIYVSVTDTNDNSAVFTKDVYEENIDEAAPPGTNIVFVRASDPDSGIFGRVVYKLTAESEAAYGHLFAVNNRTGLVSLRHNLDRETQHVYILDISASDLGAGSLPAFCKVIVHVIDVNDNEPEIQINTLSDSGDAHVIETAPIGTFVAHVTVSDLDSGLNGVVSCVLDGSLFTLDRISDSEFKLVTASKSLDRETMASHDVSITCSDSGNPPHMLTEELTVFIDDDNDHGPVFALSSYRVMFTEGNFINAQIIRMNASDADEDFNGALTYTIVDLDLDPELDTPPTDPAVYIDPTTGIVRAGMVLDYETQSTYNFLVTATDQGSPPRSATTTLILDLKDVADTAPTFDQSDYDFNVTENNANDVIVGRVHASLMTSHGEKTVVYALGAPGSDVFYVDSNTGDIIAQASLDHERHATHYLRVTATYMGYPAAVSVANVIITVNDNNDNAPVFIFPTHFNNTVAVTSSAHVGYSVATIVARDKDEKHNAAVTYWLDDHLSDAEASYFRLDDVTGRLTVADLLTELRGRRVHIELVARDRGLPYQETRSDLHVFVTSEGAKVEEQWRGERGGTFLAGSNVYLLLAIAVTLPLALLVIIVVWCYMRRRSERSDKKMLVFRHEQSRDVTAGPASAFRLMESRADFSTGSQPVTVLLSPDNCHHGSQVFGRSICSIKSGYFVM